MSFEIKSTTSCGQSLLARATATNQLVFVNAKIETTARTAVAIGSATALPVLTNPVTGAINSVTYTLNQTRVTVRFNNLTTTADFHTVWLMAKLANEDDSAAVPICAVVSQEPVYIPTTSQSDTHIDIHLNLSFVRADGQVSITEGPAYTISDHEQFRVEVRDEFDDVEADIATLQDTYVTKGTTQTITGQKTFNGTTVFTSAVQANSTLKVTGATTLGTVSAGSTTTGTLTTYAITPRTASTSSSTGYDLGAINKQWRYVFAQYGEFETSLSTNGTLSVSGLSTLSGDTSIGGALYVGDETTLEGDLTANAITSTTHLPTANSTSTSTGSDLGASDTRWRYVYGRYGDFSGSISTAGTLSVTGTSTLTGNVTVGGTLGVTGNTTLASVTAGAVSSYAITPRTASTSSSTGYDLGADGTRWKYVYARYGNFSYSLTVNGTVTATTFSGDLSGKLTTARNIDGMAFDGSSAITHFGTCSTDAATTAKTVSLDGFSLTTGARILVKFTNSNTASNPTLNVNGTGAVRIYLRVNTSASTTAVTSWEAGDTVEFVYDGSYWRKVNHTTNISGNAATATSATSATYATYLRYSSTNVLTAASTTSVSSAATISPSSNGGYSLGTTSAKWNYIYANYLGTTSYPLTSASITTAYCTNLYSSGSSAVQCLVLGTNNGYANDLSIPGTNSDGSRGYLHPVKDYGADLGSSSTCFNKLWVKDIKAYGTIDGSLSESIYSSIAARLHGTSVGCIAILRVYIGESDSSSFSGFARGTTISSSYTVSQCGISAGNSAGSLEWNYGSSSGYPVSGTWKTLNYIGKSSCHYYMVLAIRTA